MWPVGDYDILDLRFLVMWSRWMKNKHTVYIRIAAKICACVCVCVAHLNHVDIDAMATAQSCVFGCMEMIRVLELKEEVIKRNRWQLTWAAAALRRSNRRLRLTPHISKSSWPWNSELQNKEKDLGTGVWCIKHILQRRKHFFYSLFFLVHLILLHPSVENHMWSKLNHLS